MKANEVASRSLTYFLDSLTQLHHHLAKYIDRISPLSLTTSAQVYYNVISQLAALLLTSMKATPGDPTPGLASSLAASVRLSLVDLQTEAQECFADTLQALSSMHAFSTYRDAALAAKHTVAFAVAHHERELARDRSGKSGLRKEVLAEMKALDALASKALGNGKSWLKELKEKLGEGGWLDRMLEWTFEDGSEGDESKEALTQAVEDVAGGRAEAEEWASRVVESWMEGVKGWGLVKWE